MADIFSLLINRFGGLITSLFRSLVTFLFPGFIQHCNFPLEREKEKERELVVHLDRWCSVGATHKDSKLRLTPDCLLYEPTVFKECPTFSFIFGSIQLESNIFFFIIFFMLGSLSKIDVCLKYLGLGNDDFTN